MRRFRDPRPWRPLDLEDYVPRGVFEMNVEGIRRICNLGTGTVGPGITLTFALAGYEVNMYGRSNDSIKRGMNAITDMLKKFREHGLVQDSDIPEIIGRIKGVTTLEEAADGVDFVIESIVENLSAKQEIFAKMERLCLVNTIFASSTSGLTTSAIAENLEYKERFIVAHFWNPPHLIPLVEIVPGQYTSQNTTNITSKLLLKIGKKPVILKKEALGFIGNRLQFAMLREALSLIDSGVATKESIDTTIKYALGRRLSTTGPLESADLSGLDIIYDISSYLFKDLCNDTSVSHTLRAPIDEGRLGTKTGSGFYEWTPDALSKIRKVREDNLIEWLKKDRNGYLG